MPVAQADHFYVLKNILPPPTFFFFDSEHSLFKAFLTSPTLFPPLYTSRIMFAL